MKQYVKTDKFGYRLKEDDTPFVPLQDKSVSFLTKGKVYEATRAGATGVFVKNDDGVSTYVTVSSVLISDHTNSHWYFCDANGDKVDEQGNTIPTKTTTICVEKTLRYNQEVKVTVDEHERLSNLNQDYLLKELTKLFDEDVAELDDVDINVDSYDFED